MCVPDHQGNQPVLVLVLKYWGLRTEEEGRTNFQCLMTAQRGSEAWPICFPWVYLLDWNIVVMPNTSLSELAAVIYDFLLVRGPALTLPCFNPTDHLWRLRNSPSVFPQQKIRKTITCLSEKLTPLPVQIFHQARDFWKRSNTSDIFPETLTSLSL